MGWREEMDQIAKDNAGAYNPEVILGAVEAAPDLYPNIHLKLEWDNSVAAKRHRVSQVRGLIQVRVVYLEAEGKSIRVRALVNVDRGSGDYFTIASVLSDEERSTALLALALMELDAFQNKYANLLSLAPVFSAVADVKRGRGKLKEAKAG